eukprot:146159_1
MHSTVEQDGTWKCLFCDLLNEPHSPDCSQCKRANTALVNINQICLCGRKVIQYSEPWRQCYSCCKVLEAKENGYYDCSQQECTYRQMTGDCFKVCSACYENVKSSSIDSKHSFLFCKVVSMMNRIQKETKQYKDNDERRRRMDWVFVLISQRCIAKLSTFLNESEYKEIQEIFNTFYGAAMDKIKHSIDSTQLGLSSGVFVNEKNMKRNQWLKMSQLSLKWQMLADEHKYEKEKEEKVSQFEDLYCSDFVKCQIRKRVQFVMSLYKDHFLKQFVYGEDDAKGMQYIEIFENALDGYTATDLLNDYFHIESYHGQDQDLRDCKYGVDDGDGVHGDIICCTLLWREERELSHRNGKRRNNSYNKRFRQYLKPLDRKQQNILEISSKMHSFINHYAPKQQKQSKYRYKPHKYNKFVNEIACENEINEEKLENEATMFITDDLAKELHANGLSIKRCNHLMNELYENEYDSDAVIDDLSSNNDPCNQYKYSQIYQTFLTNQDKYFIKVMKKYFGLKPNDDDKVTTFELGRYETKYWQYFKNYEQYADKPKYQSLKDECLNNIIHTMDIGTFYEVLERAIVYTQSSKGQAIKALDQGYTNNQYEIPVHLPISVSHVFTLMLYCNFTDLQRNYKKHGCREANKDETIAEFIKRNREIGHWFKLLSEAIECYGTEVEHGQIFYTGIDIPVAFDTYTPRFMCPFSTTVDWNIASRFSGGKGIILQLEPQPSSFDMCFNVEWLSNYKEERERLFCSATDLRITDIQYALGNEVQYNNLYLSAFALWSDIFAGYYFIFTQKNRK